MYRLDLHEYEFSKNTHVERLGECLNFKREIVGIVEKEKSNR
jgi:hypothetical protein